MSFNCYCFLLNLLEPSLIMACVMEGITIEDLQTLLVYILKLSWIYLIQDLDQKKT